ncbi:MAG: efflux RND transporter permease subunit, partial [Deltaproteobacteria bacterium]|nr:efflux RND transporter permease subunit [Deltaproteobacteria bacterium]
AVALSRGGPGRSSEGLMFVRFRPERDRSVQDLLDGPNGIRSRFFSEVEGALALAILPQSIGRGYSQSFQLALQHDNLDKLDEYVQKVSQALRETGMLFGVRSAFEFNKPQLEVKIERERAAALGVPIDAIARTLQILFGGRDLSDIKIGGKQYDVIVQLNRESRLRPADLDRVHVRSDSGGLIQLSNLVKYSEVAGPNAIFHYNRIRSATIEGTPVGSVALGTAIENTEAILEEMLPADFRYVWKGEASDLQETGSETWFVILLAVLTIYIVLAAQFESLVHPITVMVALPLAAIGASGSLWLLNQVDSLGTMLYGWANYSPDPPAIAGILSGLVPRIPSMTINVFSQIGMVLLLGLVTKNSILLVEFANQQRAKGVSAREAMLEAAAIRFRPILMTALGTITGIFPIAIGFGAGAESRRPMGVAVVGGMTTATVLTFFVIPVVYVIFDEIKERVFSKPNPRLPGAMLLLAFLASCLFKRDILAEEASLSGPSKLSLSKAVDLALEHNLDIITAKNRIEQQRNVKLEVRSYMLPRVALDGSYEQVDDSLVETFREDAFGSNKNFDSKLELRQPLYAGGKSMAAYRRESLRELAAELELREVELEVVMDVEARFLDVLLAKSKLSVQKQSVELLEEALRSEREKLKVGDVSQFNVLRAEVEVANSLTRLIRAKNEVNLSYEELLQIIGFLQEDLSLKKKPFALDGELRQKAFAISLEDALHKALTNRPHIKRLKLLIDASKQGVKVEKADYWPVVVAVGSYGVEKSRFSNDLSDTLNGWRARIEANWKIFDSWQTSSRIAERQSEVLNAEAALRQARLDVEVEAKQAYSSLREARTLLKASRKVVETAEESVRLAINRINAGAGIQLDLLNAQVALTEARLNEVQALYDYNLAVARMKRATGKGVTDRDRGSL